MDEIISLLNNLFSKDTRYHSENEIKKALKIKGETQEKILFEALNKLTEDGIIFKENKQGYRIFPTQSGFAFGQLQINRSGTGFVHTNDEHTILIENCDLNGALNGDNVIVTNIFSKRKDYYHGEIYKITKRNTGNLIYEVIRNDDNVTLVPYNYLENVNIDINKNEFKDLIDGDLVLVNIGCESNYGIYKGNIIKTIGHNDDPNIDIKLIFEKYNIPVEFSNKVKQEIKNMSKEVTEEEIKDRTDLRDEISFTIDCDNTKDKDDSLIIKKLDNGNYLLKVNIAHVSHYIKEDSEIFKEALNRTTSHYPGLTCIPMLPRELSNGICSLNPNVDRLTRTVEMEIDSNGNVLHYDIYNSVINSKIAMSYSKVNRVLNGEYIEEYNKFKPELELLKELNIILESKKQKRNYINFDVAEPTILQNKLENKLEFKENNLGVAGQIIENCMLLANETVYNHFAWHILAYRVHEKPNEEKVREVINILRQSGIKIPKLKNIDSKSLKSIIENLGNDDISKIVKEYLLKSMKKARYDTLNVGHFALQYNTYGHFTSPIRRIIDLITHMTIDNIETFDYSEEAVKNYEKFLQKVCERTNKIEKTAKIIEDEVMDMLMAKEMEKHIGEQFEVYITDISKNSILVRTSNLIRGKIKLENMSDDKYYFDYDKKAVIGKKSKNKYQIGNKLIVLVKDASKETRTINFEIPDQKVLKKIL